MRGLTAARCLLVLVLLAYCHQHVSAQKEDDESWSKLSAEERGQMKAEREKLQREADAKEKKDLADAAARGDPTLAPGTTAAPVELSAEDQAEVDKAQKTMGKAEQVSKDAEAAEAAEPTDPPPPKNLAEQLKAQMGDMGKQFVDGVKNALNEFKQDPAKVIIRELKKILTALLPLLPKKFAVAKLPETLKELKELALQWGRTILLDCSNGVGLLKPLRPACQLIVKGIKLGKGYLGLTALKFDPKLPYIRLSGTADLSCLFGDAGSQFDFQFSANKGSVALSFQVPAPGIRLSLGEFIANFGDMMKLPAIRTFVAAAGLDLIAIRVESLGIQARPFGMRFRGTIEFLGNLMLEFVVAPTLSGSTGVVLKFGWDKGGIDKMLQKLLGPVYVVLGVVSIRTFTLALATHKLDLTQYAALSDNGQNAQYDRGITFTFAVAFDKDSPNFLQKFLGIFIVGDFMMQMTLTESKLSATLSLPDLVLHETFRFLGPKLIVTAGLVTTEVSIAVEGGLGIVLMGEPIKFKALLSFDVVGVFLVLKLTMEGWVNFRLGSFHWSIGNLFGAVGVAFVPTYLNSLGLGMGLRIGNPKDNPIVGQGYIYVNILKPQSDIWFLAKTEGMSVEGIFKHILCVPPPEWSKYCNFGGSALVSFSGIGEQTAPDGTAVPSGIQVKGTVIMWGITVSAQFNLMLEGVVPSSFTARIESSAIQLAAGLLTFSRSPENTEDGPQFNIEAKLTPFQMTFELEGYLATFMFKAGVTIVVREDLLKLRVICPIFAIFLADISVELKVGANLPAMGAALSVSLSTGALVNDAVATFDTIRRHMRENADRASREFEEAKRAPGRNYDQCRSRCPRNCENMIELAAHFQVISSDRLAELKHARTVHAQQVATLGAERAPVEPNVTLSLAEVTAVDMHLITAETHAKSFAELESQGLLRAGHEVDLTAFLETQQEILMGTSRHGTDEELLEVQAEQHSVVLDRHLQSHRSRNTLAADASFWQDTPEGRQHEDHRGGKSALVEMQSQLTEIGNFLGIEANSKCGFFDWGCQRRKDKCFSDRFWCEANCKKNWLEDVANIARKGIEKAGYEIVARVMGAAFKVFDWIKDNLALEIRFAGQVALDKFDFMTKFRIKITKAVDFGFELRIDFGVTGIQALATTVFGALKNYCLAKIPGLGDLLK